MPDEFIEYVLELFGPFGTVQARRMFGGHGVYLDGMMFALVSGEALYLKSDEMNRIEFEQAGCEIFSYQRQGKRATINFFRVPDEAMESPELMLPWARSAYAAALRANARKQVAGQDRAARRRAREIASSKAGAIAKPAKKKPVTKKAAKKTVKKKAKKKSARQLAPRRRAGR